MPNRALKITLTASLCFGMALTGGAWAQDASDRFPALWADFSTFCGSVIADPESGFTNRTPLPGYRHYGWLANEDNTNISSSQYDNSFEKSLDFDLVRAANGFGFTCQAEVSFEGSRMDSAHSAQLIRDMLQAGGVMKVMGGKAVLAPQSNEEMTSADEGEVHILVVHDWVPGQEIMVLVYITATSFSAYTHTTLGGG